jgi:hypothetical protein
LKSTLDKNSARTGRFYYNQKSWESERTSSEKGGYRDFSRKILPLPRLAANPTLKGDFRACHTKLATPGWYFLASTAINYSSKLMFAAQELFQKTFNLFAAGRFPYYLFQTAKPEYQTGWGYASHLPKYFGSGGSPPPVVAAPSSYLSANRVVLVAAAEVSRNMLTAPRSIGQRSAFADWAGGGLFLAGLDEVGITMPIEERTAAEAVAAS